MTSLGTSRPASARSAVCRVRSNSEVTQRSIVSSASASPRRRASSSPRGVNGHSTATSPFTSARALKTLSPCRARMASCMRPRLAAARLLGERKLLRARRYLPEIALGVGEVPTVASPRGGLGGLDDLATGALRLAEDFLDPLLGADVVRERHAAEAAPDGRHLRVLRELVPLVERERGRAVPEEEADPVVVLLLDGPTEALAVEPPRSRQVPDAERDHGDVR